MEVAFKYKIGQLVYYNNHLYRVLSRAYFETKDEMVKNKILEGLIIIAITEMNLMFGKMI